MFRILPIMIGILLLGSTHVFSQIGNNKVLEYRNSKDVFTVVVTRGDAGKRQTKDKALQKAAMVSQKYGFRSFSIIEENEVDVILGKQGWPSSYDFPQNLYQEEIVEKGYNRERFISGSKSDYKLRKGLRIKIKCFYTQDAGQYKVCDLVKC
ncbi:MAG: hypothetical protein WCT85_07480 [Parachlamydiales bacterium]